MGILVKKEERERAAFARRLISPGRVPSTGDFAQGNTATEQPRRGRARSPYRWNERNFTQDPQLHAPFATMRNDTPQLTPRQRQQVAVSAPAANCQRSCACLTVFAATTPPSWGATDTRGETIATQRSELPGTQPSLPTPCRLATVGREAGSAAATLTRWRAGESATREGPAPDGPDPFGERDRHAGAAAASPPAPEPVPRQHHWCQYDRRGAAKLSCAAGVAWPRAGCHASPVTRAWRWGGVTWPRAGCDAPHVAGKATQPDHTRGVKGRSAVSCI
jgi:hypothetical protein